MGKTLEFERLECPKCGGSHFGSFKVKGGEYIRTCHDEYNKGCHASWPESEDRIFAYTKRRISKFSCIGEVHSTDATIKTEKE